MPTAGQSQRDARLKQHLKTICQNLIISGAPLVMEVQVGAKQKVPMRLIAVPLPQAQADERRSRARKDRDARLHHSENCYTLLSWTLLLTNLPTVSLPARKMQELYPMRWRIDNIFRAWKGNLNPS